MKIEELKSKIELKEKELNELKEQLNRINNYETVCLINQNTSIKNYQDLKDKIKEICGNIREFEELGIKKLAYEIRKNNEAFYLRLEWEGISENIAELEKYFRENDDVLKFINIKRDNWEE